MRSGNDTDLNDDDFQRPSENQGEIAAQPIVRDVDETDGFSRAWATFDFTLTIEFHHKTK